MSSRKIKFGDKEVNKKEFYSSKQAIPLESVDLDNCIPAIDIDLVLRIDNKRAYPQAYLEQCKYKLRKRKIVNFIDDEIIDKDSENDSDSDNYVEIKNIELFR